MRLTLVTPPEVEPLTAAEVKARLNIGSEMTDDVADALIAAARQQLDGVDGWLGRALNTQVWLLTLDGFPYHCCGIKIPLPPLQEISIVEYIDGAGATQTLDPSQYRVVDGPRPVLMPAVGTSWPSVACQSEAVSIEFVAGYGDAPEDVPEPIRSAIALQVSHLRSLSARNLFVSTDSVEGVGSKSYVVGTGAGDALSAAIDSLLSTYRVLA
jgi:uncharacterized phiE125 gp8 family phage protein